MLEWQNRENLLKEIQSILFVLKYKPIGSELSFD